MITRSGKMLAIAAFALGLGTMAANAGCEGRKTTGTVVGAVAGGALGNVLTNGSTGGTVAGAVVGGVAGHELNSNGCNDRRYGRSHRRHYYRHGHRGYYDRHHRWHRD